MLSGEPKTVPAALVLSFLVLNVSTALLKSFVVVNVLCAGGDAVLGAERLHQWRGHFGRRRHGRGLRLTLRVVRLEMVERTRICAPTRDCAPIA